MEIEVLKNYNFNNLIGSGQIFFSLALHLEAGETSLRNNSNNKSEEARLGIPFFSRCWTSSSPRGRCGGTSTRPPSGNCLEAKKSSRRRDTISSGKRLWIPQCGIWPRTKEEGEGEEGEEIKASGRHFHSFLWRCVSA